MEKIETTRLKEKMAAIVKKWKGREIKDGSTEYTLRTIDRMKWRVLKKRLDKMGGITDIVEEARELFKTKES